MELAIVTDKIVYKYKNKYYTTGGFLFQIESFFAQFNSIKLITTIKDVDQFNSNFLEIKGNFKFVNFNVNVNAKNKIIKDTIHSASQIQMRLPSKNGLFFGLCLNGKVREKVRIYIGGHPVKGIEMTGGSGVKNKIKAAVNGFLTLKVVRNYQTFVTGREIQAYFKQYEIETTSIISTTIKNGDIISSPLLFKEKCKSEINILFVGRLSNEKGLNFLLEFSRKKFDVKINYHIVGEGPLKSVVQSTSTSTDNVNYYGGIYNRKELFNLIDQMHLFLLPSLSEGTPKVLVESMARGVPVIASNVGGIPSMIQHKKNGMLFDVENDVQLENIINSLIKDEKLYNQIVINGLEFAKENSLEQLNKKLVGEIEYIK